MRAILRREERGRERPLMQNHFWKIGDNFVLDRLVLFLVDVDDEYEVYRRLARHSPRAEANNAIAYNTVQWNWIQ